MSFITIPAVARSLMLVARTQPAVTAKATRKEIWADLRQRFGIPATVKLAVDLDGDNIIRNKATGNALTLGEDGKFNGEAPSPTTTRLAGAVPVGPSRAYTFIPRSALSGMTGTVVQRPDAGTVAWDQERDGLLLAR